MDKQRTERGVERNRVILRQLDFFLFTVCFVRCPFMELPVERYTHIHKAEVFAVLFTKRRG